MQMAMHRQARLCHALALMALHRSDVANERQRLACQAPGSCLGKPHCKSAHQPCPGLVAVQSLLRWRSGLPCSGKKRQWEHVQSNDQRQDPVQLKVSLRPRH